MFIILPYMIIYTPMILQIINQEMVYNFYLDGNMFVMIKKLIVKQQFFFRATKTSSATGNSDATSSPPIGDKYISIETSFNSHGANVFCSFERADIIQISVTTFCYNRCSISTNNSLKSRDRFRIQLFFKDSTRSTRYNIPKMVVLVIHQLSGRNYV